MPKIAQLKNPDPVHLKAAAGWIQLGDYDSANDELEKIRADWRAHPDVLELRRLIYSHHVQWDTCLYITSAIVKMAPFCWSKGISHTIILVIENWIIRYFWGKMTVRKCCLPPILQGKC